MLDSSYLTSIESSSERAEDNVGNRDLVASKKILAGPDDRVTILSVQKSFANSALSSLFHASSKNQTPLPNIIRSSPSGIARSLRWRRRRLPGILPMRRLLLAGEDYYFPN